jgi:hypothetical protein
VPDINGMKHGDSRILGSASKGEPMRKFILAFTVSIAVGAAACLSAPNEPSDAASSALGCTAGERPLNGVCHATCATNADCSAGLSCMNVGNGVNLCVDYQHCAHLGSDSDCEAIQGGAGSDEPYSSPYVYSTSYGTSYSSPYVGCIGDARWVTMRPIGNPSCGQPQAVLRCQMTEFGCRLVPSSTVDVADP